jgi:hypothetical protein
VSSLGAAFRWREFAVSPIVSLLVRSLPDEEPVVAPTTVQSKASLDAVQRDWLKRLGAALQVPISERGAQGAASPQSPPSADAAGNAKLQAQIQQIKDRVVPKVKSAVAADPSKKGEVLRLLETAQKQEKEESFADAFGTYKTLVATVVAALSGDDAAKYQLMLPGAKLMVQTLKDHRQKQAIAAEITTIEGYLAKAEEHAKKNEFGPACAQLQKLEVEYKKAKDIADTAAKSRDAEESLKANFNNLKANQGAASIKAEDLKAIDDAIQGLDAHIKARMKWKDFRQFVIDIRNDIADVLKTANTHGDYVGLLNNSQRQVTALEAHPNKDAIKTEIDAIKKLIDNGKKEYETNKSYEKARAELLKVDKQYKSARSTADQAGAKAFQNELAAAKLKLKELEKPEKRNPIIDGEIAAIKAKLDTAGKYANVQQFPEASKLLAEVTADLAAAEKLAARQVALNGAQKAAGEATKKIEKDSSAAVAAVQKVHDELKTHPQVTVIEVQLGDVQKTIDQAKAALV